MLLGACQFRATSCGKPVPLRLIVTVGVAVEFVAIASCPLDTPVAVGANCTFNVAVCPEFSVAGSVIVDVENEAPEAVMELIVTGPIPDDVNVIG